MKAEIPISSGLEGYGVIVGHGLRQLPSHHHDELEINLVLSGKATYLFGTRRIPVFAGSLIWIFPKQEHVLVDWSRDFSMWVVFFRPGLIRRCTDHASRRALRSPDPGDVFCRQIDPGGMDFLGNIYNDIPDDTRDAEFVNTALGYALVASWRVYQASTESLVRTDVHPAVAKAARLLSEADSPMPLDHLAREAGLSPARLSSLFKKQTGVSLTAFRQRNFLKRFFGLYRTGARYSLIEAALLAGFGSYAQFYRVFFSVMKISPASYKKSMAGPQGTAD